VREAEVILVLGAGGALPRHAVSFVTLVIELAGVANIAAGADRAAPEVDQNVRAALQVVNAILVEA
jgi:hypothetical protein